MNNLKVDCGLFEELAYSVMSKVAPEKSKYAGILCPLRGGFYLSYFMNKHLGLPIFYLEISSYKGQTQGDFQIGLQPDLAEGNFLLCDDIYDSGKTIRRIHEMYPHVTFDTVCLISKVERDDIQYGMSVEPDRWVDFYWEVM